MPRRLPRLFWIVVATVVVSVLAVRAFGAIKRPATLVESLERQTRGNTVPGVRLSVATRFVSCPSALKPCAGPAPDLSTRTNELIQRADSTARARLDIDALRVTALANILFPSSQKISLDTSVSYLQSAARLSDQPAPVLADLSAALLVRARETENAQDLHRALEEAEKALEEDATNLAARFNAAESMDLIGLRGQASAAWASYLAADSTSKWADHARARHAALSATPAKRTAPGPNASRAELEAFADTAAKEAREHGWDHVLGRWGAAVLAGDSTAARRNLEQTEALGGALARRGGDASLADAAAEIRRTGGSSLRRLAAAHREFAAARYVLERAPHGSACPRFERLRSDDHPDALRQWTETFLGVCAVRTLPGKQALELTTALVGQTDEARYPAAAGRLLWAQGVALQNANRYDEAIAGFRRAEALFRRAGEQEFEAHARMLIGNAQVEMGDADQAYAVLHESLSVLHEHPGSLGLYKNLYALRNAALADGLSHAAIRIQDEAVATAATMEPLYQAETRLARARLYLAAGRPDVTEDLMAAKPMIEAMPTGKVRTYMQADLHDSWAGFLMKHSPAQAILALDSAVAEFTVANDPSRILPALAMRADARLRLGQEDSAAADLQRAMSLLATRGDDVSSAPSRALMLESARHVFDQATMLNVRRERFREALDNVERSRASFSPVGRDSGLFRRPLRAPQGQVAVEFALVGDTLLTWTLNGTVLRFRRETIDSDTLLRDVEQVRAALELGASEDAYVVELEKLYDQLFRPIERDLGPPGTTLVIVADGELAALPMDALHNRVSRKYLVEDHPIRYAGSLRDPVLPASQPVDSLVTLFADPAFDGAEFPGLRRLEGAGAEVDSVARLYPGARTFGGVQADTAALRSAFRRGGIAHFAGHAVFDDARPERSFLVAAGSPGRLTAAEIERMQLEGLRLVVLSACQTSRAQAGRSGGFAGLAGAFLAAGAGGVIGSQWSVDDAHTRALMERFHRAYRTTGDAARALRQAQLGMLRSSNPSLRSPAAWAGFRYVGG